jgi:hypothetical protein
MRRALWCVVLLAGCFPKPTKVGDGGVGVTLRAPNLAGSHLASCDDPACGNGANPPLGGDHCPTTLACRVYDTAQPRCNWIHNLEHGHAVLAYNCPSGCPEIVQELNDIWSARQGDTQKRRIILTPDPDLPMKVAAIVWGFGWQGDTVNSGAIDTVLTHQDEEAPEKLLGCVQ